MQIKMVDLHRQYLSIKAELDEAIQSVLSSTDFIMGSQVHEFEAELAAYLGAKHVVGCASGTDALQVAMMALGIGRGDKVTSSFTFVRLPRRYVSVSADWLKCVGKRSGLHSNWSPAAGCVARQRKTRETSMRCLATGGASHASAMNHPAGFGKTC
jgi:hypothetical protein